MKARIHNMVKHTRVLGPETRAAIWFQGCNRNCKGCMSQTTRNTDGGKIVNVECLCDELLSINDIEGVTISGGEVFLQIDALYEILKTIRTKSDLGIIIYTGFYIDELKKMNNEKVNEILCGLTDIIIDGPYIEELNDGMSLKGSRNQTVNFITDRYRKYAEMYETEQRNTELYINNDELFFVGIPDKNTLSVWNKIEQKVKE